MVFSLSTHHKLLLFTLISIAALFLTTILYQNYHASSSLESAKKLDSEKNFRMAQQILTGTNRFFVLPSINDEILKELSLSYQLLKAQTTSTQSTSRDSSGGQNSSTPISSNSLSSSPKSSANSSTTSSHSSPVPLSPSPTPQGPITRITINSLSAVPSVYTSSKCFIRKSVVFSSNGSGSVSVTWRTLSIKTSSAIYNPINYNFSKSGSQTDSQNESWQGLEPGDSYQFSVTITDQANPSINTSAGPVTISSCAAPPALMSPGQPSLMTSITPGMVSVSQSQDHLFINECSMVLQQPFSVNASGSVQAIWVITSSSSGGATLYGTTRHDFSGAGSDTDTSYIRMPHLNVGDHYNITSKLVDLGNQSITATASFTSECS